MLIYVLIYVVMYVVIYVVIYRFSRCFPLVQKNLSIVIPKSYLRLLKEGSPSWHTILM